VGGSELGGFLGPSRLGGMAVPSLQYTASQDCGHSSPPDLPNSGNAAGKFPRSFQGSVSFP